MFMASYNYNFNYNGGGSSASADMIVVLLYLAAYVLALAISLAVWVFEAFLLYRLAKRSDYDKPWLAFVPFTHNYLTVILASPREFNLFNIIRTKDRNMVAWIYAFTPLILYLIMLLPLIGRLVATAGKIALMFVEWRVYYDLFRTYGKEDSAIVFSIIGEIIPIVKFVYFIIIAFGNEYNVEEADYSYSGYGKEYNGYNNSYNNNYNGNYNSNYNGNYNSNYNNSFDSNYNNGNSSNYNSGYNNGYNTGYNTPGNGYNGADSYSYGSSTSGSNSGMNGNFGMNGNNANSTSGSAGNSESKVFDDDGFY